MKYIITEHQLKLLEQETQAPQGKCDLSKMGDGPSSKEQKAQDKLDRENIAAFNRDVKQGKIENEKQFSQLASPKYDAYLSPVGKKDPTFNNEYQNFLKVNNEITQMKDDFSPEQRFAIINKIANRDKRKSSWFIINGIKKKFNHPADKPLSENDILQYIKKMGGFNSFRDWFLNGLPI